MFVNVGSRALPKRTRFNSGSFLGASVKKSADQTAFNASGAGSSVSFDAEIYDIGSWHDTVTNNSRLIVPAGYGITKVTLAGQIFTVNNSGSCFMQFMKNGNQAFDGAAGVSLPTIGTTSLLSLCAIAVPCTALDYFEILLSGESDSSIDITASKTNFTIMAVG